MLGSTTLEVAIGLTFTFLVLSLCATAVVEGLSEWRQWRGRMLHAKLRRLLGDALCDVFYQDRRIADLASGVPIAPRWWERAVAKWPWATARVATLRSRGLFTSTSHANAVAAARKLNARRLPSQIPDGVFVEVILDWLQGVHLPQELHPDYAADHILPYRLATLWHAMNVRADGSQVALRDELLRWYRQAMERTTGDYKRRIRIALYAVGAVLVLLTNADTLYISGRLYDDPALRGDYLALSERVAAECGGQADACPQLGDVARETLADPALGSGGLLGWSDLAWRQLSWLSLLGWTLTVLAIGLGADFWFGALRKMLIVRNAAPATDDDGTRKAAATPDTVAPREGVARLPLDLSAPQVAGLRGFQPLRYAESNVHAFWLAHFAALAYTPKEQLVGSPLLQHHGLEAVPFEAGGTQGFVFRSDALCILAFRGTENVLEDWLTDADVRLHAAWPDAGEGIVIHRGFHGGLEAVWSTVVATLTESKSPIWITGHSLGGALAVLAAAQLARERSDLSVAGVYTFGQPRVGSEPWTKTLPIHLTQRIFRYVNDNDIVPLVPPPLPLPLAPGQSPDERRAASYEHVGHVRYFDGSGRLHHARTVWERVAEQITPALGVIAAGGEGWAAFAKDHVRERVSDHGMARYIECLERLDAVRRLWESN